LSGKNEAQQGKDGTLIKMPNETLNEMHADNDSPTEMPSPNPTMEKASCNKDHPRSCTTGDFADAGDRLHGGARIGNSGVTLMIPYGGRVLRDADSEVTLYCHD